MNVITRDWENTTWNKGSVFDKRNFSICVGIQINEKPATVLFDSFTSSLVNPDDLYIFFNAKYDLHWDRRNNLPVAENIWCCQLAEFLLEGQVNRYPSLNDAAAKYGLGQKIDVIEEEYWNKGINTDAIPKDILTTYCAQDVSLTYKIYLEQIEQFQAKPGLYKLFRVLCKDLLCLEEMEWNGLKYDEELCKKRAEEIDQQIIQLQEQLSKIYPDVPINFSSGDQLSCFLYGGKIPYSISEHVGFFKNGKPKYKLVEHYYELPRLIEPLKGTELKKDGYFSTNEDTLRKLKGPAARKYVGLLLQLSKLEKLVSTYYKGIPEKAHSFGWANGEIHGQFNQVVAQTGRLSSSSPNLQNFAGECEDIFVTRF